MSCLKSLIVLTPVVTTLIISPGFGYDPINLPKMFVLVTGSSLMIIPFLIQYRNFSRLLKRYLYLILLIFISFFFALVNSNASTVQQIWGTWGRSTGLITYFGFLFLFGVALLMGQFGEVSFIRLSFERLSYFMTFYTLIQAADLDPIAWSQKLMVATLGNINFMSSFLGIASISMVVRIVNEKSSLSSKIHYAAFVSLNISLIWVSGSIQGIAIFITGLAVATTFWIRRHYDIKKAGLFISSFVPLGLLAFFGTTGIGPMSFLRQETVIYRLDYWLAGVRITLSHWLNGVGIDSYGDYYEEFRSKIAVDRTGPQRVTNTAHNIFLDVSSGSGLFAGILFLSLFIFTAIRIWLVMKDAKFNSDFIAYASMSVGFFVFCLISINQIGVGVWGFIFMGLVNGISVRTNELEGSKLRGASRSEKALRPNSDCWAKELNLLSTGTALVLGVIGATSSLTPNILDAKMLQYVQSRDFKEMKEFAESPLSLKFYRDKYQTLLAEEGRNAEVLEFALKEIERDPRNNVSWRVIAYSESAEVSDRIMAINSLRRLDPENAQFMADLKELESSLD